MNLVESHSEIIYPKSPYNFEATIHKPSHFPSKLDNYEKGKYWFALKIGNKVYGIKIENKGRIMKPKIKITIFSNFKLSKEELKKAIDEIIFRFEFDKDISGFYKKFSKDKILCHFIKKWKGMHGGCAQELYGLLMIGIFLQNSVVKRTVQMTNIMLKKHGLKVRFDNKEVYAFWSPKDLINVSEEELRNLKVGYRAKLFLKLSNAFIHEKIDEFELRKLSPEKVKKELIKLYGVGPETARILIQEASIIIVYLNMFLRGNKKFYPDCYLIRN